MRRNLRWLNLAASAPEDVCVSDRDAGCGKMPIDRSLVIQQQLFIRAMRNSHDVDVLEFRPRFAPVAMRQNMVAADFPTRLNFTTGRHRPMKQRVEPRDTHAPR